MSKRVELRCPRCGRFQGEFLEEIPLDAKIRFAPHAKCDMRLIIVYGVPRWLYPGEVAPEGFDRSRKVA